MRAPSAARRPLMRAVVAGWIVLAVALGGCTIRAESAATVVGPAPDIRAYEDPSGTAGEPPPDAETAEEFVPAMRTVALLDEAGALVYVERPDDATSAPDTYHSAMTALVAPITPDEAAAGLSSAVPVGTRVDDVYPVDATGQQVNVHLSAGFDVGGTDLEIRRRILQVGCTMLVNAGSDGVAADADVRWVELHIEGGDPDVPWLVIEDALALCP